MCRNRGHDRRARRITRLHTRCEHLHGGKRRGIGDTGAAIGALVGGRKAASRAPRVHIDKDLEIIILVLRDVVGARARLSSSQEVIVVVGCRGRRRRKVRRLPTRRRPIKPFVKGRRLCVNIEQLCILIVILDVLIDQFCGRKIVLRIAEHHRRLQLHWAEQAIRNVASVAEHLVERRTSECQVAVRIDVVVIVMVSSRVPSQSSQLLVVPVRCRRRHGARLRRHYDR